MGKIDFAKMKRDFETKKKSLPTILGNMAVNHFKNNFRLGGFVDQSLNPWPARKTKNKADKNNAANRAILVNTGHLRNSIRVGNANFSQIEIGAYGIPYASIHNQGGTINRASSSRTISFTRKGKKGLSFAKRNSKKVVAQARATTPGHSIVIPQRKFLGESAKLRVMIKDRIKKEMIESLTK